jgi:hypothetical protein
LRKLIGDRSVVAGSDRIKRICKPDRKLPAPVAGTLTDFRQPSEINPFRLSQFIAFSLSFPSFSIDLSTSLVLVLSLIENGFAVFKVHRRKKLIFLEAVRHLPEEVNL